MKKRHLILTIAAAVLMSIAVCSCEDLFNAGGGSISVTMPESSSSRAAAPDNLSYYEITASCEVLDYSKTKSLQGASSFYFCDLEAGDYTVTVKAYDASGNLFASGFDSVTVNKGSTATASIKLINDFMQIKGVTIRGTETWTPTSSVFVSGRSFTIDDFYICDHEVTQSEYYAVCGGSILNGNNYPVYSMRWYNALVYCNQRSINEGLTPCYTISSSTNPSDWGTVPTSNDATWNAATCDFTANGYRIPTEAEWEYAARGGQNYTYSGSDILDDVAWNNESSIKEVKGKKANGYGLYDMTGNAWEWCWDWYADTLSSTTSGTGPSSGSNRHLRGSCYNGYNAFTSFPVSYRYGFNPGSTCDSIGFRVVRSK